MDCEVKINFSQNIKGFKKFYYGKESTSFFPINYVPVLETLFSFLVKPPTDYAFLFEGEHPFGAFERNSALKIFDCEIEIKNSSFCIKEKIDLEGIRYSNVNRDLNVSDFVDIDEFIVWTADRVKNLLEKQYYEYNFLNEDDYNCRFVFNFKVKEIILHPYLSSYPFFEESD